MDKSKAQCIEFTKMHGLGNDFVVIDATSKELELSPEQCQQIADRHFGVGCDQILLVESPRDSDCDFYYRIYNADGSEVEQCGNGARCFAVFVRSKGLTDKNVIRVGTMSGTIQLHIEESGLVRVDMGAPILEPEQIPFEADQFQTAYPVELNGEEITIGAVSMGNPHAVIKVDDVDVAPVTEIGPAMEQHHRFPQRVNVGFMQVIDPENIRLRVFERGTGETLACGTGACAAVVSGILQGALNKQVHVSLPGGNLMIKWEGDGQPVLMSGPAASVFEGSIEL
jgi:diaminopimelate epimerase